MMTIMVRMTVKVKTGKQMGEQDATELSFQLPLNLPAKRMTHNLVVQNTVNCKRLMSSCDNRG